MSQKLRGVVSLMKGEPLLVETIVIPDPGPGEAVVKVQACGVCHTDLHYREGGINDEFPFLLGHEAAGVVESVGEGVSEVAPGDYVILNWRAVDGTCRACRRGEPWYWVLTPGYSPGSWCLHAPDLGTVCTGDTLLQGGPGATGRSYSSFNTSPESSRTTLLTLPGDTTVRTGHVDSASIGGGALHLEEGWPECTDATSDRTETRPPATPTQGELSCLILPSPPATLPSATSR